MHAIQLTVELPKADSKFLAAIAGHRRIFAKAAEGVPGANDVFNCGREGLGIWDCHDLEWCDLRSRHHTTPGQAAAGHRRVRRTRV